MSMAPKAIDVAFGRVYAIGPARFDTSAYEVRVKGQAVAVEPKVFDVLVHLLRHRDRVVLKSELLDAFWTGLSVSPHALKRTISVARRVLAEACGPAAEIRNVARRGYRLVGDVIELEGDAPRTTTGSMAPIPAPAPDGISAPFLVGRDPELRRLERVYREVCDRNVRICLLYGEPGIGKTSLAEALTRYAHQRGATVLTARGTQRASAPSFGLWAQLLRSFEDQRGTHALLAALGASVHDIIPILRELSDRVPASDPDPEGGRGRLFDAVLRFFRAAAKSGPIVLFLDDVHLLDDGSLSLLEFLTRTLSGVPILLILTYVELSPATPTVWSGILGSLATDSRCSFIPLKGLDLGDLGRMLEEQLGNDPPHEIVQAVQGSTGGNPFFVREVAFLLREEGMISRFRVPDRVRDVVLRRVSLVSPECASLLPICAVLGDVFDLPLLCTVADRAPHDALMPLDEAVSARFFTSAGPDSFRFAHGLLRDTIYAGIARTERARLHGRVADALRARSGALAFERLEWLERLAYHLFEALPVGSASDAIEYCRRAGSESMRQHAYEAAELQFERAAHVLERYAPDRAADRAEVLLMLGFARRARGDHVERVRSAFEDAARLAPTSDLLARAAVAYGDQGSGDTPFARNCLSPDETAIRLLEDALRTEPRDLSLRALLRARLAAELHSEDQARRDALSDEAVRLADASGSPDLMARAHLLRAHVLFDDVSALEARAFAARRAVELAREASANSVRVHAHLSCSACLLETGDLEGVDAHVAMAVTVAERMKRPLEAVQALAWRATRATIEGRFQDAEALNAAFLDRAQDAYAGGRDAALLQWLKLRMLQGRFDELAPWEDFVTEVRRDRHAWRAGLALVYAETGRIELAAREFSGLVANALRDVPRDWSWLVTVAYLADLCAELEAQEHAALLYDALEPFADRVVTFGILFYDGAVRARLGRLAMLLERPDVANAHFEAALDHEERFGAHPFVARTCYHFGRALLRSGTRRPRQALYLLERAHRKSTTLGLAWLADESTRLYASKRPTSAETG